MSKQLLCLSLAHSNLLIWEIKMLGRFQKWAEREFGIPQRLIATLGGIILFTLIIPLLIISASRWLDKTVGIARIHFGMVNTIIGGLVFVIGLVFAAWSILTQILFARGTPLPMMPTQSLLTSPPFSYCRNPMSGGALMMYYGICIGLGSISGMVIVSLLVGIAAFYLKKVEEKELEMRFGQAYLDYKARTPFWIPKFRKTNRKKN
jgi:protein-S-isoprenylcysteine O-methyltransferase Ste14